MLRLPNVGRALAGAAKGSLASSNTGKTRVCVCVYAHLCPCGYVVFGVGAHTCRCQLHYIALQETLYIHIFCIHFIRETELNSSKSGQFVSTSSAYTSACCQQHGGSVCGWETSGGGAWNYRAAGVEQQNILLKIKLLLCIFLSIYHH